MTKPLAGIRIADFSHVMAGPYASHLLQMMGAEVIKIEPKSGDNFRNYGKDRRYDGMSPAFLAANVGKKSIALDLKAEKDLEIASAIVAQSDVLLENFRPGVIDRLGLGYEKVRQDNPDIIFCSVSGYGQDGPQRDWPAIDNIVQATSGMMLLSGNEGDPPVRVGFPIVDTLTGQTAAMAILGALMKRQGGGGGSYIDVSMFDASLAFMTSALTPYLVTGEPMARMGNTGYSGLPTASLFTARDNREISLGVVQPNQFEALARHVAREDWLTDPRFASPESRRANFELMKAEIAAVVATRDAIDWESSMSAAGIPCGMVRRVDEAVALAREDSLISVSMPSYPGGADWKVPNAGFRMSGSASASNLPAPELDEHRAEILAWLSGPT
jgi:crotonobetainyl-CoA:carnitine CoA-transferase CaiB-like acyl-CoA transferase